METTMGKKWRNSMILAGTVTMAALPTLDQTVEAGALDVPVTAQVTTSLVETLVNGMNFGSIDLNPAGDTITLASEGANGGVADTTATSSSHSVITGTQTSGAINVASGVNLEILVDYPDSVTLTNGTGDTATLAKIDEHSGAGNTAGQLSYNATSTNVTIHIGGELTFPAGSGTGTYNGTLSLTVNYL